MPRDDLKIAILDGKKVLLAGNQVWGPEEIAKRLEQIDLTRAKLQGFYDEIKGEGEDKPDG